MRKPPRRCSAKDGSFVYTIQQVTSPICGGGMRKLSNKQIFLSSPPPPYQQLTFFTCYLDGTLDMRTCKLISHFWAAVPVPSYIDSMMHGAIPGVCFIFLLQTRPESNIARLRIGRINYWNWYLCVMNVYVTMFSGRCCPGICLPARRVEETISVFLRSPHCVCLLIRVPP